MLLQLFNINRIKFAKLIVRYQSPSGVFLVVLLNGGNKKTAR
ncbi:hypothetical protein HMP0721_1296 [Pseudoramibacter alactolyticus ATCC 23263]|uniref:Uncharacterized protein n=1 Tax=Pseudoramibacter alactolyticus ATCC 23263 TaxID=887929 RepID=E6MH12_9FIRM|nr:hypothetical protein HMP0721_1296 [Pseudoramibacter alactolyticus ATCC 23263]